MKLAIKERLAASGAASKLLSKLPGRGDKKPGKKRRWKKFAVAGVALVVAAGVGWQLLSPRPSSAAPGPPLHPVRPGTIKPPPSLTPEEGLSFYFQLIRRRSGNSTRAVRRR